MKQLKNDLFFTVNYRDVTSQYIQDFTWHIMLIFGKAKMPVRITVIILSI